MYRREEKKIFEQNPGINRSDQIRIRDKEWSQKAFQVLILGLLILVI